MSAPATRACGSVGTASVVAVLALALGGALVAAGSTSAASLTSRPGSELISNGGQIYAEHCAMCHGTPSEARAPVGQGGPTDAKAGASWVAPPLGAGGHAWQHTDAELVQTISRGLAPPGAAVAMPAFAGKLSAGEISAVLAFVKTSWPANIRRYQAALNPGGHGTLFSWLRDPGWTFPAQCSATGQTPEPPRT